MSNSVQTSEAPAKTPARPNRLWTISRHFLLNYFPAVLVFAAFIGLWQLYVSVSGIRQTVLPGPARVMEALLDFRDIIIEHTWYTLGETFVGFGVALSSGFLFAVVLDASPLLRRAVYPLLISSQTVPLVAIAPLLIIWFGYDFLPKVIVVWLVCFFPVVVGGVDGFAATEPEQLRLFKSMNATRWQIFWKLKLPSALPFLFSGIRIAITYSVAGAVLGEYVGAEKGLGIFIQRSKNSFRNDLIFAAVLVTAVISIGLFIAVTLIQRRVMPWYYQMRATRQTKS